MVSTMCQPGEVTGHLCVPVSGSEEKTGGSAEWGIEKDSAKVMSPAWPPGPWSCRGHFEMLW